MSPLLQFVESTFHAHPPRYKCSILSSQVEEAISEHYDRWRSQTNLATLGELVLRLKKKGFPVQDFCFNCGQLFRHAEGCERDVGEVDYAFIQTALKDLYAETNSLERQYRRTEITLAAVFAATSVFTAIIVSIWNPWL